MEKSIKISVIVACYNGEKYLIEAINGLRSQNFSLEILVMDDESVDTSVQIATILGCTVRTVPHGGQAAARNAGLRIARGQFIMFHDQDDVLCPGALRSMAEPLESNVTIAAVMAQTVDFLSPELDDDERRKLSPRPEPYFGFLGATLFRKETLAALGGCSESLKAGEAADLLFRLQTAGHIVRHLPVTVMKRRLHTRNTSRLMRQTQFRDYASVLRGHLAH